MYFLQRIQNRISAFLDKKRLDAEMEEEMRGHVELQTRANLAAGMNPEEASRAARKEFGRADSIQEQCRDQRGTRWFEDLCQDLRFGIRQLRKNPGFTVVATLALAVGICAVTTQFTLFNGVLLRGLPFPDAGRLVNVALHDPAGAPDNDTWPAFEIFVEWQRHQRTCQKLAACDTYRWLNVVVEGVPRPVSGAFVTHDYFPVLGVAPLLGRGFSETDDRPGAEPVVMISHLMWQRDFGGRADVAGRTLRFEGKIATVIGVMPPGFSFPEQQQIWSPMPASVSPDFPLGRNVTVLARLKPGMTVAQATADFGGITGRMADRFPDNYRRFTAARVEPLEGRLLAGMRGTLEALLAAAVAVLLIACLNLMNLQFVRVSARMRELATRGALGAPRARLLRQMLTEGVVLVVAGSAIGVALTHWTIRLCRAALGQIRFAAMPDWVITSIDWNVLAFTLVATAGGVLASSLLPALFASRMDAMTVLRQSLHGQSNRHVARMGHGLVIAQIGLTCALLVASLLQVKSIRKHAALDFGFRTDSVMAGRLNLEFGYPTQPDRVAFYQRFLRELRIKPEFSGVAMTSRSLMVGGGWTERFQTESDATNGPGSSRPFQVEYVSDAYFSTLGLKPREGREFEPNERGRGERPALVNETLARKYLGGGSALGRRLRMLRDGNPEEWLAIVGVVPDTHLQGPFGTDQEDGAGVFLPMEGFVPVYPTVVVRGHARAETLGVPLRRAVNQFDPNLAPYSVATPEANLLAMNGQARVIAAMSTVFAGIACVLATLGLYGVASFVVSQRRKDLGIRMALGADRARVMGIVLRQGGIQFASGTALGILLALAVTRLGNAQFEGFLYQVNAHDPAVYATVVVLLAFASALACILPARRAARVNPMVVLRSE